VGCGGDAFDNLTNTGVMEIANLSLVEPELEHILFVGEAVGESDPLSLEIRS
jgi:hypothetical protein